MRRSTALATALALGIGSSAAQAAIVSFESLLAPGASIQAADKLFSDFELGDVFWLGDGVTEPDTSLIDVETLDDGGADPGPGLRFTFNGQLTVDGVTDGFEFAEFIDFPFSFRVTDLNNRSLIKDNSLLLEAEIDYDSASTVTAFVVETVFAPGDDVNPISDIDAELSYTSPASGGPGLVDRPTADAVFDPLRSILVTKNILVSAQLDGDVANVIAIEQRFSQTPVPATAMLLGLGLVGFAAMRRRRA